MWMVGKQHSRTGLVWKSQLFAMHNLGQIVVEEIGIQHGLHDAGSPRDPITLALNEPTVDPIQNVEESIPAQGEQVVARQRFSASSPLQQEQLGQYRCGLEPLAERPQAFDHIKPVTVEEQRHNGTRHDQVPYAESVVLGVIRRFEAISHQKYNVVGGEEEEKLHQCVVKGNKGEE